MISSATRNQSGDGLHRLLNRRLSAALFALVISAAALAVEPCTNQFGTNRVWWSTGVSNHLTTAQLETMTNLNCYGLPTDYPAYDNTQAHVAARFELDEETLYVTSKTISQTDTVAIATLTTNLTLAAKLKRSQRRAMELAKAITP